MEANEGLYVYVYGVMGLSPIQLAELTPYQLELKMKGFSDAKKNTEQNFRKLAWITFAMQADPKASKGITINDVWPMAGDKARPSKALYSKREVTKMLKIFQQRKTIA